MPKAAPRPCRQPGCGRLVPFGEVCAKHPVKRGSFSDRSRGTRQQRGYGAEWDRKRPVILARDNGLCQPCKRKGILTPGNIVDHIKSKSEDGTDDDDNLQTICKFCHRIKTAEEAARGRGVGMFSSLITGPSLP